MGVTLTVGDFGYKGNFCILIFATQICTCIFPNKVLTNNCPLFLDFPYL